MVDPADASTIAQVFSMLACLSVSDALLQQVKSSIPPPSAEPKTVGPEKQLQVLAGNISLLQQQLAKLTKTRVRLVAELDACHTQTASKNSELESLQAQYREVRDSGKFTPTKVTPAPSIVAVLVNDDDVHSVDAAMFDGNAGPGSCGGEGQADAQDEPVPMEEGLPPARRVPGGSGTKRCVNAGGGFYRAVALHG